MRAPFLFMAAGMPDCATHRVPRFTGVTESGARPADLIIDW
jgi:hypothetical protein